MKKLMIAAAIVCAAAVTQAATVQWTANGISTVATQGKGEDAVALAGATYYCFLTVDDAGRWENVISVADAIKLVEAKNWTELAKYAVDTKTTTAAGAISSNKKDLWSKNDAQPTGFAIILDTEAPADAQNYMVTSTSGSSPAFSKDTTAAKIALGSQVENTWHSLGGGDVPEPTSALLMLIGVAGLALRRKQK